MAEARTESLLTRWLPGNSTRERTLVLFAFFAIYVIWGSTYLAIRYAVETIPPLFVAGTRHLIAGGLLFAWCWWKGLRPTAAQWRASLVVGALFFLGGHGLLHWAEQYVASGLAALLIATEPIMIAVLAAMAGQARITLPSAAGMLLGLGGVAMLMYGNMNGSGRTELIGAIAVLMGAFSWALGIIYSAKGKLHPDPVMSAAMSLLAGTVLLLGTGLAVGEGARLHPASVTTASFLSLLYLVFFGSLVAFTAYVWLLQRCSATLVATHTYVNPVVAVLLGWALAGESFTMRGLFGAAAVIVAIVLVGRSERKPAVEGVPSHAISAPARKTA
ncbi:MAG: EamA family transporter [Acidobacteriales bacterium]|nr:EamA family transporter [Terriglobales bacterium]